MRYQCHECDRQFEEPDIVTETHGMTDGSCEKHGVCPYCKGYYEEVYQCKICGDHFTDDELTAGVCDACIYNNATVERCIRYGADCEENVPINGFIASVLSADKINEILSNELLKANAIIPIDCSGFVDDDKIDFANNFKTEKMEDF